MLSGSLGVWKHILPLSLAGSFAKSNYKLTATSSEQCERHLRMPRSRPVGDVSDVH